MSHQNAGAVAARQGQSRGRVTTGRLTRAGAVLAAMSLCLLSSAVPAVSADVTKVMPLGDSITDGYDVPGGYRVGLEDALLADGRRVDFVGSQSNGPAALTDREHEGHSGWRIDQLTANVEPWLEAHQPAVVLLMIGTNDMVQGHELAAAPQRLGDLIDRIAAKVPSATILVSTLTPLGWAEGDARVGAFNDALPALVEARVSQGKRLRLVDMHPALTAADLSDRVHPNATGYSKMAAVWGAALRDVLPSDPPPSDPPPSDPPPSDPPPSDPPPSDPPPAAPAPAPVVPPVAVPPPPAPPADPVTRRLDGADRYSTAAAIVRDTFPSGPLPVVYMTSGEDYADALVGGPAAHIAGGVVLPLPRTGVPEPVRDELLRLRPAKIVVLGGRRAVSDVQLAALDAYTAGSVIRVAGADRYDTAGKVATRAFPGPVPHVLIATGAGFADALTAGAAGARTGSPVLLVSPTTVPTATADALRSLKPTSITVLGGRSAVSDRVLGLLAGFSGGGGARRVAGVDRYATAALLTQQVWRESTPVVYLATGRDFPDALAGIAAAGRAGAPLLLTEQGCLPAASERQLDRLAPKTVVVLGGTRTVSDAAGRGLPCASSAAAAG